VTIRQHHSFIRLPDEDYEERDFHPYAAFNAISYYDYATPIAAPLEKRKIIRHRLTKKSVNSTSSEAVEPIIYYMDPGCPEPIRSALMEGAAWWDQAFQAAGFAPGTFQVKDLPSGADMMDVRYNVIQWVHRSTRGWSYGASVVDPRTGEILKGHVSLGSLRVRQDFLIAQGILSPYADENDNHERMQEMALARLRQLAAHEVGHTIGLAHNFASSVNSRASVMDYPHPYIELTTSGELDFSKVYDTDIGAWDKIAINYGYRQYASKKEEAEGLKEIVDNAQKDGYHFISDRDARPTGGAHPHAHLWDNGANIPDELLRMLRVRSNSLKRFGQASITDGTPLSELEKVLAPLYLMHRYQMEGTAKLIGGLNYQYSVKGDHTDHTVSPIPLVEQSDAIKAILYTLTPEQLALPDQIISLIPPPAFGYSRDRETFEGRTNVAFDIMAPAESYIEMAFSMLLHPERLSRIHRHNIGHQHPMKLSEYLGQISSNIFVQESLDPYHKSLEQMVRHGLTAQLLRLAHGQELDPNVAIDVWETLQTIQSKYLSTENAADKYLNKVIEKGLDNPDEIDIPKLHRMPPGSPIGCGGDVLGSR